MTSTVLSIRAPAENVRQAWTDEAVAIACRSGDPQAIAELFDRFQVPVTRFLSRLVGGSDVEDLVQSTFLQVVCGRAQYDGRASVKTWLFAIAANMMRRHWRASARRAQVFWVLACVSRTSTDDRSSEQLDARRNVQQIRAAFDALSEKVRIAFVLCELEGISAKEASIVLESSETAVWKRVSDARRILLKAVGEPQP